MARRPAFILFAVAVLIASLWGVTYALNILKGVMPGEVSRPHEKFEDKCLLCHKIASKDFKSKCVSCHDHQEIKEDLERSRGFHGKTDADRCEVCHAEHNGRAAALVVFDPQGFDHSLTEYPLVGRHREVACGECHRERKFRSSPKACFACHEKDDYHKGTLGTACGNCHVAEGWKIIRFDHDKTDFPLEGKHQIVKCAQCHVSNRLKETPKSCAGCHKKDDVHKGRLARCEQCHKAADWKQTRFDHSKTRYPLLGEHRKVPCRRCHLKERYRNLDTACIACHQKDDPHQGILGRRCESCHLERGWKTVTFDHEKTDFPLSGGHRKTGCLLCHKNPRLDKTPTTCAGCHKKDDVHKGRLGEKCEGCHDARTWKKAPRFTHEKTRFPLHGKHKPVACKKCHLSQLFSDTSRVCYDCHKKDDVHRGRFGKKCEACHTDQTFERQDFDHKKETGYALLFKHKEVKCLDCHVRPLHTQKTSRLCVICHRKDDVHTGELGQRCEKCHSEAGFKVVKRSF